MPGANGITMPSTPASALDRALRRRRVRNVGWWIASGAGLGFMAVPVIWVLVGVIQDALPGWRWDIFTKSTNGLGGGLANTIAGTFVLMAGVGILTGVVGIGMGVYLSEIAPHGRASAILRAASEVLSGIPSIVFGYAGYIALVVGLHWGFSLAAALIVLSLLVVPYVSKSTEIALNQVPRDYREGAEALGMSEGRKLRSVVMPSAVPGMATGLIVALAISVGETAPLLYTAGFSNSFPSTSLVHAPVPYITYATFTFWNQPTEAMKALSFDSSVLLVALVALLIGASRLVVRASTRYAPGRPERRRWSRRRPAALGPSRHSPDARP